METSFFKLCKLLIKLKKFGGLCALKLLKLARSPIPGAIIDVPIKSLLMNVPECNLTLWKTL